MDERRKFFRFEAPVNVKYALENKKNALKGTTCTKNISREGLAFAIKKRLPKRKLVAMEFEIPGDNIPIFAQGVVAWAKKSNNDKRDPFEVGVRLVEIARPDRARILDYVYKQWLKIRKLNVK